MPVGPKMTLAILFMLGTCVQVAWADTCPDDPEVDLCDVTTGGDLEEYDGANGASKLHGTGANSLMLMLIAAMRANDVKNPALAMLLLPIANVLPKAMAAGEIETFATTCGDLKTVYKDGACCGSPSTEIPFQLVPNPTARMTGTNPCDGKKGLTSPTFDNKACFIDGVAQAGEQAGADITDGFMGTMDTNVAPITDPYYKTNLCPVNVHWHLGAEHRSAGEFDETGTSPETAGTPADSNPDETRRLSGDQARYGYACLKYDADDSKFNTEYNWMHCNDMHVGETYEVHWPHSAMGACGTPNQYQSPFYDGVFCGATEESLTDLLADPDASQIIANTIGVQGQVFTIVNDENYFYPDLMRGMIVDSDHDMGIDVAAYTGSTTGTSRDNEICSFYTPITWQVDRKCHLISASSFDKLCADMKQQRDDMTDDLYPHGARELVLASLTANNHVDQIP